MSKASLSQGCTYVTVARKDTCGRTWLVATLGAATSIVRRRRETTAPTIRSVRRQCHARLFSPRIRTSEGVIQLNVSFLDKSAESGVNRGGKIRLWHDGTIPAASVPGCITLRGEDASDVNCAHIVLFHKDETVTILKLFFAMGSFRQPPCF